MMWGKVQRRIDGEHGFAMISAIMIMVLVLLVTAVGALAVVRSFDETRRDRSSTTALSAADSAVETLVWRMNKQLVASEIEHLGGLGQALISELGCADVGVDGRVQVNLSGSASDCTLTVTVGDGAQASCESRLAVTVTTEGLVNLTALSAAAPPLLARDIVCSSTVNGATRRIFARVSIEVGVAGTLASPLSLWTRTSWEECPSDPAAACPPA